MHAVQGALAVRRERNKRLQRRLSDKNKSLRNGSGGSRRPSDDVEGGEVVEQPREGTSMTSFYIGVVFILLGFLLIFSSMIPANVVNADWSKLLGVGVAFLIVGLLMVMVNRILSAQEDEELKTYVSTRLGRTRSGQVLCRSRNTSMDFSKLAPPGGPPSRRGSYRDRPGSTRSINRSPSMKQTVGGGKVIERNNSVRKSIKRPSPSQSVSSTTGLVGHASISRSNSTRVKNSHHSDINTSMARSNTTKENFRGRATSFKTRNLPTVLVQLTDDKNNSSSLLLLGPNPEPNTKNSSYTNGKNDLPMVHSSTSMNSYRNSSKILTHKSFDCINDNQEEDVHKYSETDSLLPKKEINAVIVGSTTQRSSTQPVSILSKSRQNNGMKNPLEDNRTQSNRQPSINKFNSDRTMKTVSRSRTISES